LAFSSTYAILVVVLWLFIWLKLLIWPVPGAFGLGCVEEAILLCGEGVGRIAKAIEYPEVHKAIEYLEVAAQKKRGSGKCASARLALKIWSPARVSAEDCRIHGRFSTNLVKQFESNLHLFVQQFPQIYFPTL